MFVVALICFFLSAILIVWLCAARRWYSNTLGAGGEGHCIDATLCTPCTTVIGADNWVDIDVPAYRVDNQSIVMTVDGRVKVRCLDFQDDEKDDMQVTFGRAVAIINSVVFITSVLAGGLFGYYVARESSVPLRPSLLSNTTGTRGQRRPPVNPRHLLAYCDSGQFDEERLQHWYEVWQEKDKAKKAARKKARIARDEARDFRRIAARLENPDGESDATELVAQGAPHLASAI